MARLDQPRHAVDQGPGLARAGAGDDEDGARALEELFVTLPYHGPNDMRNHEYVGQVLRVDMSREDQWGVALQLLTPLTSNEVRK